MKIKVEMAIGISVLIAIYMGISEAFGRLWFYDMLMFAVIIIIITLGYENKV